MSLVTTFRIETSPWAGFTEAALPTGVWVAQGTAPGDGSGGFLSASFLLQLAGDPLSSRIFNLEQLSAHVGSGTGGEGSLRIHNLGHLTQDRPMADRIYSLFFRNFPTSASGLDQSLMNLPIMLGAPSSVGDVANVDVEFTNSTPQNLVATLWGYIWEPRSILAAGGLQRPATAIFGR